MALLFGMIQFSQFPVRSTGFRRQCSISRLVLTAIASRSGMKPCPRSREGRGRLAGPNDVGTRNGSVFQVWDMAVEKGGVIRDARLSRQSHEPLNSARGNLISLPLQLWRPESRPSPASPDRRVVGL